MADPARSLPEAFARAASAFNAGRLAEAEQLCRRLVIAHPALGEAFHLLAIVQTQLGKADEALASYDRAAALRPNDPEIVCNRGVALLRLRRSADALASIDRALELRPVYQQAHANRGLALVRLGRFDEALAACDRALALAPDDADTLSHRGLALHGLRRLDEALASYDRALALRPGFAEALANRGATRQHLQQFDGALLDFDRALRLRPDMPDALYNHGVTLYDLGRYEQALESYDRALALVPDHVHALANRGSALIELRRHQDALESFDRALALAPDHAGAWCVRGSALRSLARLDEALASHDRALALRPDFVQALGERGTTLNAMARYGDALENYERAVGLWPEYAQGHVNIGLLRLLLGDFPGGWAKYEWRKKLKGSGAINRAFVQPLWSGAEDLAGKTILVYSEQGLGDTIHFCRYVPMLAARGARVVLGVQESLLGLVASLPGVSEIVALTAPLPPFDFHSPLLGLPLAFDTLPETIPAPVPYLRATDEAARKWATRLSSTRRPRIGLVWSGSTLHANDQIRSIGLRALLPLLQIEATFVSLQKDVRPADAELLARRKDILDFGRELGDFSDTAGLVEQLDLVISVDTAVAHLAGALGKPVWILLSFVPDWRWQLDRSDSPWYPTARLFRQDETRSWSDVVRRVASALVSTLRSHQADELVKQANALYRSKRFDEALPAYDRAVAQQPEHAGAFANRGAALHRLGRFEEALADHDRAIALRPSHSEALSNRGVTLRELGRFDEALDACERAIALQPDNADAHFNAALVRLLTGDVERGWKKYEWRWKTPMTAGAQDFDQPLWLGDQDVRGKTVFLHHEQGLGDTLQFCRYVALVAARGARVILGVQPPLAGLLADIEGVSQIVADGDPLPAFDLHCPLLSLPLACGTTLATIPASVPYLRPPASTAQKWAARLEGASGPRVGLVWSGAEDHPRDRLRSIDLNALRPLLKTGATFVSLQPRVRPRDEPILKQSGILGFGRELQDFADTAGLIEQLDLVIAVDTSVVHLAGALGKPVWVLLPHVPDWRWLLGREDSPWYPTARLFRQDATRTWDGVIARVGAALRDFGKER
ncbi:MAG TPA: tetratricopeptide repeat protein [Reyranella sp.]|nr:tetratricopeptide repeat protein [Reyranella sp.]